jgi:hypothetical protein
MDAHSTLAQGVRQQWLLLEENAGDSPWVKASARALNCQPDRVLTGDDDPQAIEAPAATQGIAALYEATATTHRARGLPQRK